MTISNAKRWLAIAGALLCGVLALGVPCFHAAWATELGTAPSGATYVVETSDELSEALGDIAASADETATIELKGGESFKVPAADYCATFGAEGKKIIVTSSGDTQAALDFCYVGYLAGDCTFDNVHVTGSKLFCNGHQTVFTAASAFDFSITVYGGANNADVDSTHLVIAGSGSINVGATNGSHNIVGGCLAGSVHGDTYLEVSGNVAMKGGNVLTPASVLSDGTSSSVKADYVSVDGNAKLVYDNGGLGTPAIDGTYGCEIKGDLTIEARAGQCNGISAQREFVEKSIIDGNVHIVAGSPQYANTDRALRVNSNWGIFGAGTGMSNFDSAQYQVGGNVTVYAYENVWGWNRGTDPTRSDTPEIYGAKHADVKGGVTVNVYGSHVGNVFGADDTSVAGALDMVLTDVELKNSYYGGDYDQCGIFGLYTEVGNPSAGSLSIKVNGGDWALLFGTDFDSAPEGSTITVTGKSNIRLGVSGVQASKLPDHGVMPTVTFDGVEANIPFVQECESVNLKNDSNVTLQDHKWIRGIDIAQGSMLTTTEDNHMYVYGDANINGAWMQEHAAATDYFDLWVQGNTTVGKNGLLVSKGTATFAGNVENSGTMALMNPTHVAGNYTGTNAELRLPVVGENYDGTDDGGDIPLIVDGASTGSSTVCTVAADDYGTLVAPEVGQNYILSMAQDNDAPVQSVFMLGNDDAVCDGLYLKRVADVDPDDPDSYRMWQVAKGDIDSSIAATVAPMNLTVYTGGEGYHGVIGDDGQFISNDFPEMGFYFVLPQSINDLLGSSGDDAVNLTDKVALTYDDPERGTMRSWSLELYGNEDQSHVTMGGRSVYIYKIKPSQIDGTSKTIPFRVQFEDEDGNVMEDTDFDASDVDQFRKFTASVYSEGLDASKLRITATVDGKTVTRPVVFGTSTLTIRANTDEEYTDVLRETPSVDPNDQNAVLAGVAQPDTDFFINQSGVRVTDTSGVKLMVDSTLDDDNLEKYLDTKKNVDDRFSYEFKYMDLVDTNNGNAYLTLGEGQSVNVYWPVPADAADDSEFYIVHFKGLNRDSNTGLGEMLETYTPEEPAGEKVQIDGKDFIKFAVSTFSPFALMYEKAATVSYKFVGDDVPENASVPASASVILGKTYNAAAAPSAEGWTFDGWYTDEACTSKFADGTTVDADMVLYGKWSKIRVTVSYKFVNDGPNDVNAPVDAVLSYGDKYTAEAAPSADGWRFDGWCTDEECANAFEDGMPIKADAVLYGKWTKLVPATPLQASVAYECVGNVPDGIQAPEMDMVALGDKYTAKSQDGVEGYAFDGWYTDEACTSKFADGTAINCNTVLYGKWAKTTPAIPLQACVSYVYVGQAPDGVSAPGYDLVALGTAYTAKQRASVEGWTFDGWYVDDACTQRFVDGSSVDANMVLYGKWAKIPVKVSYKFLNQGPDGVNAPADAVLSCGDAYTAADKLSAEGWTFGGWYVDEACTEEFENGTKINADTVLYGTWAKVPVTVSYKFVNEGPDGVNVPGDVQLSYGDEYTAETAPSVDGWRFDGWCTDEECQAKFVDGTAMKADTVLFGKWTRLIPATPLQASVAYEFVGDAPDGVQAPEMDIVALGTEYAAKQQSDVEGYVFDGWYAGKACTLKFVDGTAINANTVLYGKWRKTTPAIPLQACVSYAFVGQAPDGVSAPGYDMVGLGAAYTAKQQAAVDGWTFDGWYVDSQCTVPFVDGTKIDGNAILYGKWAKIPVTVSYEFVNQGPDGMAAPEGAKLSYGDPYTAAAAPSAEGWRFDGWFTDASCSSNFVDGAAIKSDIVLYGKWTKLVPATPLQASVAYRFVGDVPDGAAVTAMDMVALGSEYAAKQQAGVEGYAFDGWYTDEACTSRFADGTAIDYNTVLYGKWAKTTPAIPLQACVSYVYVGQAPDGATAPGYDMVDLGAAYTAKRQAAVDGWTFDGWFTDEACIQRFVDGSSVNANMVLYGAWSQVESPKPDEPKQDTPSTDNPTDVVNPVPDGDQVQSTPANGEAANAQPTQSGEGQFARTSDPLSITVSSPVSLVLACAAAFAIAMRKLRRLH